ncbi:unnamed protein product [Urochloa decumbens]|uniref:BZIP domain-containing protein n=1 Tax=Urochloa decumbens TaxID=240449 RepID=A0ABC8XPQ4_9POAL
MLSVQESFDLVDFAAATSSCCVPRDLGMDIITCGFTPWGADTCPSLDQVMASSSRAPAPETAEVGEQAAEAPGEAVAEEQERRRRRKESNRLSARRSRERKQQRLEELRGEAARLRAERQGLESRLHDLARCGAVVCRQNARLRAEAAALESRLRAAEARRRTIALRRRLLALRQAALLPPPHQPMMMTTPLQQQAAGVAPPLGLASLMT